MAVVGATFAYFTATVENTYSPSNGATSIEAAKVATKTVVASIDSEAGKFTATDVYPGHKEIAGLQVKVTGTEGDTSAIKIKYAVTENGFKDDINVTVYGLENQLSIGSTEENNTWFGCTKQTKKSSDEQKTLYYETCAEKTNELPAAKKIGETKTLKTAGGPETLEFDDVITISGGTDATKYYYVVIEYENDTEETAEGQNDQMSKSVEGTISVRAA